LAILSFLGEAGSVVRLAKGLVELPLNKPVFFSSLASQAHVLQAAFE